MAAEIIDGKAFAEGLRERVGKLAASFEKEAGRKAGLAVVLVGEDPASQIYVRNKGKQTVACGMASFEQENVELQAGRQYEMEIELIRMSPPVPSAKSQAGNNRRR